MVDGKIDDLLVGSVFIRCLLMIRSSTTDVILQHHSCHLLIYNQAKDPTEISILQILNLKLNRGQERKSTSYWGFTSL